MATTLPPVTPGELLLEELCRFFGRSEGYWLRAQVAYDTEVAHGRLAGELAKIRPWSGTAAQVR